MTKLVLHLIWDGDLGGVQRYVQSITTSDNWNNISHAIVVFSKSGRLLNSKNLFPTPVYELGLTRGWHLLKAIKIIKLCRELNPVAIHCHCDTLAFSLLLKHLNNIRLIYTEHGDTLTRSKRTDITNYIWKIMGRYWTTLIMNSKYVQTEFLKSYPQLKHKTTVILNPLCNPKQVTRSIPQSPIVGVFARLTPEKGIDWLIRIAIICKIVIPEIKFEIFGDGPLREDIEKTIRENQLSETVLLNGYINNPLEKMAQMTCTAVPSKIETFGLVALEAQSVGVPVIGFTNSGVAEIVINNETGKIIPYGNLERMAEAIIELCQSKEIIEQMGHRAKQHACNSFDIKKHVQQLETIYTKDF